MKSSRSFSDICNMDDQISQQINENCFVCIENISFLPLKNHLLPDASKDESMSVDFIAEKLQDRQFFQTSSFYGNNNNKYLNPLERQKENKCVALSNEDKDLNVDVKKRKKKIKEKSKKISSKKKFKKLPVKIISGTDSKKTLGEITENTLVSKKANDASGLDSENNGAVQCEANKTAPRKFFVSGSPRIAINYKYARNIMHTKSRLKKLKTNFTSCDIKSKKLSNIKPSKLSNVKPSGDDSKSQSVGKVEQNSDISTSFSKSSEPLQTMPTEQQRSTSLLEDRILKIAEEIERNEPPLRSPSNKIVVEHCQIPADTGQYYSIFCSKPKQKDCGRTQQKERKQNNSVGDPLKQKQFVKVLDSDGKTQLIIDAGQKEIGAKQCPTCGMLYTIGNAEDEKLHINYHDLFLTNLKFPGWKDERVLGKFSDGRVIIVDRNDFKWTTRKMKDILEVVNRDIGFPESGYGTKLNYAVILFVSNQRMVVGCLVADIITSARRVVLNTSLDAEDNMILKSGNNEKGYWCCSREVVRAKLGVNRIWTASDHRRQKIATRMLDCLRSNFIYGYVVPVDELAFSDPSFNGREFAAAYVGTDNFLVYK